METSLYRLLWRNQLIATLNEVHPFDFPWVCARFVAEEMDPQIYQFLQWIDRESKTEDGIINDPPFPNELLDDWYIEKPDGSKSEIMFPVFDFSDGTVEWR